jgi:hypothetical protein
MFLSKRDRYDAKKYPNLLHLKEFLLSSQSGQDLYYFHYGHRDEKDINNPIHLSIIDLDKALAETTENLNEYSSNIYQPPL